MFSSVTLSFSILCFFFFRFLLFFFVILLGPSGCIQDIEDSDGNSGLCRKRCIREKRHQEIEEEEAQSMEKDIESQS